MRMLQGRGNRIAYRFEVSGNRRPWSVDYLVDATTGGATVWGHNVIE